jgi:hypothetical protein
MYYRRAAFCCAFFFWAKRFNEKDIPKEMFPVYGGKCLSGKAVHNSVEKFSKECSKISDDAQPRHPIEIVTETTAAGERVDSS